MSIERIEIIESPQVVAVKSTGQRIVVGEPRIQIVTRGIRGDPGPPGSGGLAAVVDDTSPELGGDLDLNGFDIFGQMDNQTLILDGGLI